MAREIIATVDKGSSAVLAMPLYSRWIGLMGVLPVGVQAIARRVSGIDGAMKTFEGRGKGGEKESLI